MHFSVLSHQPFRKRCSDECIRKTRGWPWASIPWQDIFISTWSLQRSKTPWGEVRFYCWSLSYCALVLTIPIYGTLFCRIYTLQTKMEPEHIPLLVRCSDVFDLPGCQQLQPTSLEGHVSFHVISKGQPIWGWWRDAMLHIFEAV